MLANGDDNSALMVFKRLEFFSKLKNLVKSFSKLTVYW